MSSREALIKPRPKLRSKEQIIAALKAAARKLGHAPTRIERHLMTGISRSEVVWRFHGYRAEGLRMYHDPLPIGIGIGFGIAWPLGHPRATQAPRKGRPRVDWRK